MKCPFCAEENTKVIDSRPGNIMQIVTGAIIAIPIILVSRVGMAKVKRSMEA